MARSQTWAAFLPLTAVASNRLSAESAKLRHGPPFKHRTNRRAAKLASRCVANVNGVAAARRDEGHQGGPVGGVFDA